MLLNSPTDIVSTGSTSAGIREGQLNKFVATINKRGLAVTNRYEVLITPPTIMDTIFKERIDNMDNYLMANALTMFCKSVEIPDLNLATAPLKRYGEDIEIPYQRTYSPVTMTFYVDSSLMIKQYFDSWMSGIIDVDSNVSRYMIDYAGEITIQVINKDSAAVQEYHLIEAFPKTISNIGLAADGSGMMELQVSFAFKKWRSYQHSIDDLREDKVTLRGVKSKGFRSSISSVAQSIENGMNAFDTLKTTTKSLQKDYKAGNWGSLIGKADTIFSEVTGGIANAPVGATSESDIKFAELIKGDDVL